MFNLLGIFLIGAALHLCALASQADYIPPGEVAIKTTAHHISDPKIRPGTYFYDIDWQGIPVAEAQIIVRERLVNGQKFFYVEAKSKTYSGIDLFYKMRHTSQSLFHANTLSPVSFYSNQIANSKVKTRRVKFDSNGQITSKVWADGKEIEDIEFKSENQTLDPISAAFLAKSLSVNKEGDKSFDVFNGKHRYLIAFDVQGHEKTKVEGKKIDAIRIKPSIKKLTDSEGEKRFKWATIWISDDDRNEILKLESKVFIGKVTAELERFEPDFSAPLPLQAKLDLSSTPSPLEPAIR